MPDQKGTRSSYVVPGSIRIVAALAACSSAVFFLWLGAPLLIGAIIQSRARTTGRWLLWVGATLLSLPLVLVRTAFTDFFRAARSPDGPIFMSSLFVLCLALVVACDLSLIWNAFLVTRKPWLRGSLDWVVWVTAAILTALPLWMLPGVAYSYRVNGRLDILLTTMGLIALAALFDAALIVHAVKTRGSRSDDTPALP